MHCTNLASSEWSPLQALRVPDRPIWASQFHPELDCESNHERYKAYIERYDPGALEDEGSSWVSRESKEVSTLLPKFLAMIGGT
jgi:GMP synthase-like glutamine amidotransferase